MARGFIVDAFLNATRWLRGAKDMEQSIQDLEGALGDAEAEVKKIDSAGEKAFRGVGDEADKTGKDVTQLEKKFREVRDAADDMGDGAKKSFKKASEGAEEFKNEAGQSGREAAASFSGGFDDVADFVQETLANALSGFGPAGAAAGIALAAVVGTVLNNAVIAEEKLAEARERASELASTMYENGGTLPLTERVEELFQLLTSERKARTPLENVINDYTDLGTVLDAVKVSARETQIPMSRLVDILSGGDVAGAKDVLKAIGEELESISEELKTTNAFESGPIYERKNALEAVKTEMEGVVKQQELASQALNSGDFLGKKKVEELGEAWRNAQVDAANYFSETEEGATSFDWGAYLADGEATLAAADELKRNIVGLPPEIKAEAERVFSEQGAVAANEYAKAYIGASSADKGRFISVAQSNGAAAGQAQGQAMKDAFGSPILSATIRAVRDTSAWDNYSPSAKQVALYVNPILGRGGSQSTFRQPL
jgi:ElaB/YqjD/DUF883 family membrane-anchored ribosome-binding protein